MWNNRLFTYGLLEGLKTRNSDLNKDGNTTISEVRSYVIIKVEELTKGGQYRTSRAENLEWDCTLE